MNKKHRQGDIKLRVLRIVIGVTVSTALAWCMVSDYYEHKKLQYDYKVVKNELDAFKINYERSAEEIYYTIQDQKHRIKSMTEEIETLIETIETKDNTIEKLTSEIEGLTSEVEKLEKEAKTVAVSPSYYFNDSEIDLLYRLVEAEAGGESIQGRIAVANVVLNRIKSDNYPDTIHDVIYQRNQFEVVNIGTIDTKIPSEETIDAVNRALAGEKVVPDSVVMFWATYLDKSHAIWRHADIVTTIGVHHFSNGWR